MKKLVILGAGTAGTMMANKMHRNLDPKEWRITVIDKSHVHYYQPGYIFLPFKLFGYLDAEHNARPIKSYLPDDVEFIREEIKSLDTAKKVVTTTQHEVNYDWLIIATGTRIAPEEIPGMVEGYGKNIFYFYTMKSAMDLQQPMADFRKGKLVIEVTEYPIKCPVAPIEFACLADYYFTKRGLRKDVEIEVVTSQASLFSKPVASKVLTEMFEKKNINITSNFAVSEIDHQKREISSFGGPKINYDMLVAIPPNLGYDFIDDAGIGNGAGFVVTDQATLKCPKAENVYAIGDCTNLPSSKAGSVAHFEAAILEHNLMADINGKEPTDSFDGHSLCYIETGYKKAHLIDFNYKQEPVPGDLPAPLVGPFTLLKETRMNHYGKLFFRWYYWNILLKDRVSKLMELFLPTKMSRVGKRFPKKAD